MFWLSKGVCVCAPTKDSGGPSCAHSGRSGCSGGSVLAAWGCTCCTAPSAAALSREHNINKAFSVEMGHALLPRLYFLFPHLSEVCEGPWEDVQDRL